MAADVKNIIVGAADLWVSKVDGDDRTSSHTDPDFSGSGKASGLSALTSNFNNAGYTSEGLEISYEPDYGEVTVDQLLDAAKLFKQGLKVMIKTSLVEGTLANMNLAFGQAGSNLVNNGSQLNLNAGALGDKPVERSIVAIGQAPGAVAAGTARERVYVARRVVSMETVSHSLRRTEATTFPVTFRSLPDDAYPTSQYGKVIDRVYTV